MPSRSGWGWIQSTEIEGLSARGVETPSEPVVPDTPPKESGGALNWYYSMKIGIVSAQKHCKTHLRQLTEDGHDVYCLGARPSKIPPSYDVLIVRIASMRHTNTYKEWAKTTGRPVIYEDGLSGARRELAKIQAQSEPRPQTVPTAAISVNDVRCEMLEWGRALMDARPDDRRGDVARHLTRTLYDQFPSMASDSKALVASVVGELFAAPSFVVAAPETAPMTPEPTPPPQEAPAVTQEATPMPDYPTQSVPWETVKTTEKWCKIYTPPKLNKAWDRAQRMITTDLTDRQQDKFVGAWKSRAEKGQPIQRDLVRALKPLVSGRPLAFVMFVYLVLPEGHKIRKGALYEVYKQITDKGSDTRLSYAVEWYLNLGIETTAMPEALVVDPPEEAAPPAPAGGPSMLAPLPSSLLKNAPRNDAAVGDNTQAILEIMEDISSLKGKLSALESGAPSTAPASATWVKDVVAEAVEAMREELRSDLADAFASLAADHPNGVGSSNPLSELEQIKAMLKGYGFKGTLTIEID